MRSHKLLLSLALTAVMAVPAFTQVKPDVSTTKVKKVLHYIKCGGWLHVDGQADLTKVLDALAKEKKFTVTHTGDETVLNLANLKTYNAIIWDNNVDGGGSVPTTPGKQAVLDYVAQGGGWLLVHGAGDHHNSWSDLQKLLGTTFSQHGNQGSGEVTFDAEAKAHPELKYMLQGLPPKGTIVKDEWYAFQNTVRGQAGVTVVAIAGKGNSDVILAYDDKSSDANHTYIWAKPMGKGRTLYTAIGHGGNGLYEQDSSFATKSFYENLRYVAGDYQNGCTNKLAPNFDAGARVDNGTCTGVGISASHKSFNKLNVSFSAMKAQQFSVEIPVSGNFSLELRNAQGKLVWRNSNLNNNSVSINLAMHSGMYYLNAISGKTKVSQKIILL